MQPATHAWIIDGRLAVAERPGGGGRSHRVERRIAEQAWWREQGVTTIVSTMSTRHSLLEYALDRFAVRWFPLLDEASAPVTLAALGDEVATLLAEDAGAVLVHCDRPGEWLAAVDAALRLRLGLAGSCGEALGGAERDGLPVGSLANGIVGAYEETLRRGAEVA
jgi:hypothetical protein